VFLWKVEELSLVDSFYCVFYGDKSFPSFCHMLDDHEYCHQAQFSSTLGSTTLRDGRKC
jgi:hypothetical protein